MGESQNNVRVAVARLVPVNAAPDVMLNAAVAHLAAARVADDLPAGTLNPFLVRQTHVVTHRLVPFGKSAS
jgi:hypothetical protein